MKESKFYFFILSAALMLLVLSAAIAFPILFRPFYYAHIAALDLPGRTGWSAAEIRNAYDEMLDYCILGAPFGTGVLRWSYSGMAHFADCARLFRLDFAILGASALTLGGCAVAHRCGVRAARPLGRGSAFGPKSSGCGRHLACRPGSAELRCRFRTLSPSLFSGQGQLAF